MNGIDKAIKKAGGEVKLARLVGTDRQLVTYWQRTGKPGATYCMAINEATGVPLHVLRPDVFPK